MNLRIKLVSVMVAIVGLAVVGQASALTTFSQSGSPGAWLSPTSWVNCELGGIVTAPAANVGRSAASANSVQTITERTSIFRYDGSGWVLYSYGPVQSFNTRPGQYAPFASQRLAVRPSGGPTYYAIVMEFWWVVGNTTIGYAADSFNGQYLSWSYSSQSAYGCIF